MEANRLAQIAMLAGVVTLAPVVALVLTPGPPRSSASPDTTPPPASAPATAPVGSPAVGWVMGAFEHCWDYVPNSATLKGTGIAHWQDRCCWCGVTVEAWAEQGPLHDGPFATTSAPVQVTRRSAVPASCRRRE